MTEEVAIVASETSRFTKKIESSVYSLACDPSLKIFKKTNID